MGRRPVRARPGTEVPCGGPRAAPAPQAKLPWPLSGGSPRQEPEGAGRREPDAGQLIERTEVYLSLRWDPAPVGGAILHDRLTGKVAGDGWVARAWDGPAADRSDSSISDRKR